MKTRTSERGHFCGHPLRDVSWELSWCVPAGLKMGKVNPLDNPAGALLWALSRGGLVDLLLSTRGPTRGVESCSHLLCAFAQFLYTASGSLLCHCSSLKTIHRHTCKYSLIPLREHMVVVSVRWRKFPGLLPQDF